jgi:hypothetical protein
MSHDQFIATEPTQVPVDQAEYAKFCYLIKMMDALDRADARAEKDIQHFKSTEGIRAEREFDWNSVTRHCAPQLLITFLRGAERYEDERKFRKFPHSVIVVRTAFVVYLDEVFELALEVDDGHKSVANSGELFRQLRVLAQQQEGIVAVDADRLITRLSRVLKLK